MNAAPGSGRRAQLGILAGLFFDRLFASELLAVEEQSREKLFVALGILAGGSSLVAYYLLLWRYLFLPDDSRAWLDQSIFTSLAMGAVALVAVLVWDSLFVDRVDLANLGALPVRPTTLVAAKLVGLVAFGGACAASMALPSAVLFAGILSRFHGEDLTWGVRAVVGHAVAVTAAGLVVFLACAVLQGLLMLGLGAERCRRVGLLLRTALVVGVLLLVAQVGPVHRALADARLGDPASVLTYPPMWFVGLEATICGTDAPELQRGAIVAGGSLALLLLAAPALVLAGVRGVTPHGEPPAARRGPRAHPGWLGRLLHRLAPAPAQERGLYDFCGACMGRSVRHRLLLVTLTAMGLGLMLPWVAEAAMGPGRGQPGGALLALPHVLGFMLVVGVRWAVASPAAPEAAWLFRTVPLGDRRTVQDAVRKAAVLKVLLPLVGAMLPMYVVLWGPGTALLHCVFALSAAAVLAELALARFQHVPFASPAAGGMGDLKATWAVWVVGLFTYASSLTLIETRFIGAWAFWVLWASLVGVGMWIAAEVRRVVRRTPLPPGLDDEPEAPFVVLGLDA